MGAGREQPLDPVMMSQGGLVRENALCRSANMTPLVGCEQVKAEWKDALASWLDSESKYRELHASARRQGATGAGFWLRIAVSD